MLLGRGGVPANADLSRPGFGPLGHRNVADLTITAPWQKWNSAGRFVLEKAHIDASNFSR